MSMPRHLGTIHQKGEPQAHCRNSKRHPCTNPLVDHQSWYHQGNNDHSRQGQEFPRQLQNHSPTASAAVLVLSWGVVRWNAMVISRFCSPSAATALIA